MKYLINLPEILTGTRTIHCKKTAKVTHTPIKNHKTMSSYEFDTTKNEDGAMIVAQYLYWGKYKITHEVSIKNDMQKITMITNHDLLTTGENTLSGIVEVDGSRKSASLFISETLYERTMLDEDEIVIDSFALGDSLD